MIVQLTSRELTYLSSVLLVGRDDLIEALHAEVETLHWTKEGRGKSVLVNAPYIAWVRVRVEIEDVVFNAKGQRQRPPRYEGGAGVKMMASSALQRITKATNFVESHPALKEMALVGRHPHIFHVWRLPLPDERGRLYSPAPVPGAPFMVLGPVWRKFKGMEITTWAGVGSKPTADRLAEPMVHEALA